MELFVRKFAQTFLAHRGTQMPEGAHPNGMRAHRKAQPKSKTSEELLWLLLPVVMS